MTTMIVKVQRPLVSSVAKALAALILKHAGGGVQN